MIFTQTRSKVQENLGYISRIYILETARFCFSLTWMDGPRGAGRLGVAAEGGAKPIGLNFPSKALKR